MINANIKIKPIPELSEFLSSDYDNKNNFENYRIEDKVKILLLRDLIKLNWNLKTQNGFVTLSPPLFYDKEIIKQSMLEKRNEKILENKIWINNNTKIVLENLANGEDVLKSDIKPRIEVCENEYQHNVFRMFRYYWSSPYSDYVGRRIRIIIRDDGIKNSPVIGILALGSSIIHMPDRDKWIGWNKEIRTNNLINAMDLYVLGALPPYNDLLGGKLIAYIAASNEVRNIYKDKYKNKNTIIRNRKSNELACFFTTSLYGKSSQYNRIKFNNELIYAPIGSTAGYGTLHISNDTFNNMNLMLKHNNILITNRFGDGPNWRMRVIRTACDLIGFESAILLRHSFRRNIYVIPMMENYKEFLCGNDISPSYYDRPMDLMVNYWKKRWLDMRKKNNEVINNVIKFCPSNLNFNNF